MKNVTRLAAVAAGLMIAGSAFADPTSVGGCPKGGNWILEPVSGFNTIDDVGNNKDQNGDTFGCERLIPGKKVDGGGKPFAVWKDNTNKLPD